MSISIIILELERLIDNIVEIEHSIALDLMGKNQLLYELNNIKSELYKIIDKIIDNG